MQPLTDSPVLAFCQISFRVVYPAHILNIMQAVVCRNDVVVCTRRTVGRYRTAACQLLNAWVRAVKRIR
ncbi:Uncharacterised protein [Shigella sonnei]|nr:Uncharacterised protein [Shigella sonnei]